jgi:hypothetical protein
MLMLASASGSQAVHAEQGFKTCQHVCVTGIQADSSGTREVALWIRPYSKFFKARKVFGEIVYPCNA